MKKLRILLLKILLLSSLEILCTLSDQSLILAKIIASKRSRKSVDISSKEVSSTYLRNESVYWYKIGSDRKARRFMTVWTGAKTNM